MHISLLELLRCPRTGSRLDLHDAVESGAHVMQGTLVAAAGGARYPILNGIPRFVPASNYADNFGIQWNRFRKTQLDSQSGHPISRTRFYDYSGWEPAMLRGRRVLDVGCGAGRFTEVALEAGANVVAIDYSSAVDACWTNHQHHENLDVVQADIYELPFAPARFDFVFCFGVLQHTPDVESAFKALPSQVAPSGRLAVDVYPRLARNIFWSKYWLRPITKRMPSTRLFELCQRFVPGLLAVSRVVNRIPMIGPKLRFLIPVVNYEGDYPLTDSQIREWAVLDTFDMLAPAHDHPQTAATLKRWFLENGLEEVEVFRRGFFVGRGVRRGLHSA
jgi:SAM-dependent methyltransferase